MMIKNHKIKYMIGLFLILISVACKKEFLDVKPQKQQVIVESLQDVAALLDNADIMNRTDYFRLISDGDFYYTESKLLSISEVHRNLYLWKSDIDPTNFNNSPWDLPYQQIMYANIALETLDGMKNFGGNEEQWKNLYGSALFYRAWAHYQLLQDFAEGYDPTVESQLGVPIVTNSTYPKSINRESLLEGYGFINDQLIKALPLLPEKSSIKTRPSVQVVYSLKARLHLNVHNYEQALLASEKCMAIDDSIVDFNLLKLSDASPFSVYNFNTHPEIIFFASSNVPLVGIAGIEVENQLYKSYIDGDCRKLLFFNTQRLYTGTYSGNSQYHFTGMANDEIFLIKAECLARLDRQNESLAVMQKLLKYRFESKAMYGNALTDKKQLLQWILKERQKELVGRGSRWTDLKRLNRNDETKINLSRTYMNSSYALSANSNRYVFAIPEEDVLMSGLKQNERN
ncbi:RagB/SusD family nutrient uptake outer membrane protein [Sphingobacterium kitahiroshimense]|uniref:RagB/SusD family nutrient uptake outer membrane protein n=1 Tax=Sphingobacterium kitahiroshimense TaxID=470446 RepID=UPI00320A9880